MIAVGVSCLLALVAAIMLASMRVHDRDETALEQMAEAWARLIVLVFVALPLATASIMSDAIRAFPSFVRWYYRRFMREAEAKKSTTASEAWPAPASGQ